MRLHEAVALAILSLKDRAVPLEEVYEIVGDGPEQDEGQQSRGTKDVPQQQTIPGRKVVLYLASSLLPQQACYHSMCAEVVQEANPACDA